MVITKVYAVYFSPTGNVEKVAVRLGQTVAAALDVPFVKVDFTLPAARKDAYTFCPTDLVFFATPTYAGRVPNKLLPFVQSGFTGNGAWAVPVAVFGNRSFDSALVELRNTLEQNGFHTVAGAGIATAHVFSEKIAAQRPDETDWTAIAGFAAQVADKLKALSQPSSIPVDVGRTEVGAYYTPLGTDGKPALFLKAKPQTEADKCDGCGACVEACPMGSISAENPLEVPGACIKCHACVHICPTQAKFFADPAFLSHVAMLEQSYARRAEPQFFL